MFIDIAEYRPDVASLNTDATDAIRNVFPADGSYIPAPLFETITGSFDHTPVGAFSARSLDGTTAVFVGTTSNLYLLDNTTYTWKKVNKAEHTYSAPAEDGWSFAAFGDLVIAVNPNDPPQVYDLSGSSEFRDLGGNPPRAGLVKIWGDFVCLMRLPDNKNRVYWSGLNDAEHWTLGEKSCDYQDFPDGGVVQGSNEATDPMIFMQTAIYAGQFIAGSDIVFSFKKIHDKRGAKSSRSLASRGAYTFFADEGGFFQISADGQLVPIGFEKVDRTFFSKLDASNISEMLGAIDPFHNRVYWAMDYTGAGRYNEMLVYDWGLQKWTIVDIDVTYIFPFYTSGYTLDGLDAVSKSLDLIPSSLDSKLWQGGAPVLGAFSRDYKLGSFTGKNMQAFVTSQEVGSTSGTVQRLQSVYPIVDTDENLVQVGWRFRRTQTEQFKWLNETSPSENTGQHHKRSRARFHRFRLRIPQGALWSHIKGFDVNLSEAGMR